jgi:hypothetical protein
MPKLDYAEEERQAIIKNNLALQRKVLDGSFIKDKALLTKIQNYATRNSLPFALILYEMKNNDLFCLHFAKSPIKQSFHQTLAFKYLKSIPGISNPELLPSSGTDAKYQISGMVLSEAQSKGSSSKGKSIDFEWQFKSSKTGKTITCYATHKFTRDFGGAQDNQFKDVVEFLRNAVAAKSNDLFFFAICDGPYYLAPYENCSSKIDYLNTQYSGSRCKAVTIDQLEEFVKTNL